MYVDRVAQNTVMHATIWMHVPGNAKSSDANKVLQQYTCTGDAEKNEPTNMYRTQRLATKDMHLQGDTE